MIIWLVEDDYLQSERTEAGLKEAFPDAKICVIETEYGFRKSIEILQPPYPSIAIIDIMLRWANPSPNMPEPGDKIKKEGYYRAGFRCEKMIRETSIIESIPIILYTVLERNDIKKEIQKKHSRTRYIEKKLSIQYLINTISDLLPTTSRH